MSDQQNSPAVAAARALVEAGDIHDYEAVRTALADGVSITMTAADPDFPKTELNGIEAYLQQIRQFKDAVVPGSTEVVEAVGDDKQALLRVNSKIKLGPDGPELDAHSARMYVLDDSGKIKVEHVIFFVT